MSYPTSTEDGTINLVLNCVAKEIRKEYPQFEGVKFTELIGRKSRKREIVYARQMSYFFIKENTFCSLKYLGTLFCAKPQDHSTVIHACQTISDLYCSDKATIRMVNAIRADITELKAVKDPTKIENAFKFTEFFMPKIASPVNGVLCC